MSKKKTISKTTVQKKKKKPSKFSNLLWNLMFVVGFLVCMYPVFSNLMDHQAQYDAVHTYQEHIKETKTDEIENIIKDAKIYNKKIYEFQKTGKADDDLSDLNYKSKLSIENSPVMGTIEIPKIDVDLPIYHGTSDAVLSDGIGHLASSSLPVGGNNTRAVLTGHRGAPNAKLFTRLDELEKGDLFYIKVGNDTLAYKVYKIQIIKPSQVDRVKIEEGEDEVSLLTCTPYGISSHRLVVTGKRTKYVPEVKESIKKGIPSIRELTFTAAPVFLAGYFVTKSMYLRSRRKRKIRRLMR